MVDFNSLTLTRRSGPKQDTGESGTEDRRIVEENAFSTMVVNATRQGVKDTLGPDVVGILESKGFLDNADDPVEFDRQLTTVFGNGAKVLERLVVKELYHELGIAFNSSTPFSYSDSLEVAKQYCFVRGRVR